MTRSEVEATLPKLPEQMRRIVASLLGGPKTAVQLVDLYCLSARTQVSKARRRHGIPIAGEKVEGKPYWRYWLAFDEEPQP